MEPRLPPRSNSTPLFEQVYNNGIAPEQGAAWNSVGVDCQRNGSGQSKPYSRSVWRIHDEKSKTQSDRSARSVERVKIECLNLRTELVNRRKEVHQLQQRVQILEGALQNRTQQLEQLVEEVRTIIGGNDNSVAGPTTHVPNDRRLAETLDQIIRVHWETNLKLEVRENELQDVLKERHAESQTENQQLTMKARSCDKNNLRQRLGQARRSARKQEELLAAYEHSHHDLYKRMQKMGQQLENERLVRREKERTAQRLGEALTTSCAKQRLRNAINAANECNGVAPDNVQMDNSTPNKSLPPKPVLTGEAVLSCGKSNISGVGVMRQELEAMRGEEREQRAAARKQRQAGVLAEDVVGSPNIGTEERGRGEEGQEIVALRAALAEAQANEEIIIGEAEQAEQECLEELQDSEDRIWCMTEMVNELALQSDIREMQALHAEVEMKRQLSAAESRCSVLEAVAGSMANAVPNARPCPYCGRTT